MIIGIITATLAVIYIFFIWSVCKISGKCSDYEDAAYARMVKGGNKK